MGWRAQECDADGNALSATITEVKDLHTVAYLDALYFCKTAEVNKTVIGSKEHKLRRKVLRGMIHDLPRSTKFRFDQGVFIDPKPFIRKVSTLDLFILPAKLTLLNFPADNDDGFFVILLTRLGEKRIRVNLVVPERPISCITTFILTQSENDAIISEIYPALKHDEAEYMDLLIKWMAVLLYSIDKERKVIDIQQKLHMPVATDDEGDLFHTVTIYPNKPRLRYTPRIEPTGITHREHDVRSHWRHYEKPIKSGPNKGLMRVRISNHVRGDRSKGRIYKDYKVVE